MYPLLRPALFRLDPETAHHLTLDSLNAAYRFGLSGLVAPAIPADPRSVMGLTFPNPVGLAAGLDKNGDCIDGLAALGFGFIEIGTITPLPQPGNPQPRLFRLPQANAIINRMGFNNDGVDKLVENVRRADFKGVLGINIGKNAATPIERAADDYLICLRKTYAHASYITVNISSPNTKNLRQLQDEAALNDLLALLKSEQQKLADQHGKYVPIALKIAPDMEGEQIAQIARLLTQHGMDGVIATNTTVSREGVENLPHGDETGGLSGAPVRDKSTAVLRQLVTELHACAAQGMGKPVPVIGVGGILNGADAAEKMAAGASLVQIYSGLIYRGPKLVSECCTAIRDGGLGPN
ncbi:MAG: quinone-dependent dihydroorotate dehydrogenase [Gallionella sp.]|nr:quinone-dependent dihydroorotate dehydrogenase [Gallionella sp.]MDD4947068.1 quinone-dependent dihydroorotate dehydrogenase [Gallionella sp.]